MSVLTVLAISVIFGCGAHLMVRGDAVRLAAGSLLLTNAAILLVMSSGFGGNRMPMASAGVPADQADPLVQALALTAVVIGFGTTVLLLRIAVEVERTHGTIRMDDLVEAEIAEGDDDTERRGDEDAP